MHRLAALSTRKCTLETYRSIPPSYKIAEGPSLANHPKLQDGSEATMWVSQGWPHMYTESVRMIKMTGGRLCATCLTSETSMTILNVCGDLGDCVGSNN